MAGMVVPLVATALLVAAVVWLWRATPPSPPTSRLLWTGEAGPAEPGLEDQLPAGLTPTETLTAAAVALVGAGLLVWRGAFPLALAWLALVWAVWQALEERRRQRWARDLDLQMLAAGRQLRLLLAAGVGLLETLRILAERPEVTSPLKEELRRLRRLVAAGERPDRALLRMANGRRYRATTVTRGLYRHLGLALRDYLTPGQMADLLWRYLYVAGVATEIRREMQVEMTMARLTRLVAGLVPVAVVLVFRFLAPEFWAHLVGERPGQIALATAAALVLAAHLVGRRLEGELRVDI